MKLALALCVASAMAVAPPRISLNLDYVSDTIDGKLDKYGSAATLKALKTDDPSHHHNLGYEGHRNARQDWTQRCPAGPSTTAVNCPVPQAQAFDHTDGALPVTTTIHLVDLNNKHVPKNKSIRDRIDYTKRSTYLIFFDAQDAAGNHAEQVVFAILLDDTTKPTITSSCSSVSLVEASTTEWNNICWDDKAYDTYDLDVTATIRYQVQDAADGTFLPCDASDVDSTTSCTAEQAKTLIDGKQVGVYDITVTAHDHAGMYGHEFKNNAVLATRQVVVQDTTRPVITRTGAQKVYHQCAKDGGYVDDGATCADSHEGAETVRDDADESVKANKVGSYTVTYQCNDNAVNPLDNDAPRRNFALEVERVVEVHDKEKPEMTRRGAYIIEHHSSEDNRFVEELTDPGVTCIDRCDLGCEQGNCAITTSWDKTFDDRTKGDYKRSYTCTDSSGNKETIERIFRVVDKQAPVIHLVGTNPLTVEASNTATYADQGATCEDWHHGPLTPTIADDDLVNLKVPGTYVVKYTCTDPENNGTDKERNVVVVDTTCPTLELQGDAVEYIEAGFQWTDAGAKASDNLDGSGPQMQARITRDGDVNEQNAFYSRRSCKQIKQYYAAASDGEYFITVFVNDEFKRIKVWCDMTTAPNQVQAGFTYAAVSGGTEAVQKGDFAGDCAGMGMTMAKFHSNTKLEDAAKLHYCPNANEDACPWFDAGSEKTNYYVCELTADFEGTDHMTHDVAHDEIASAEQGKYVLTYHVTDFSENQECHPVFRTVIVKDTLPPVIQLRWADKGVVAVGDHSHRGVGNVKNPYPFKGQVDSDSQVADPRHDATGLEPRKSANSSIRTEEDLMAEVTTGGSAWLAASAAAAVAGLALLGFSQRKQTAVSVPV